MNLRAPLTSSPMSTPSTPDEHVEAVRRDYNARTDEWRSIYEGTSFHDHTIRVRLERAVELARPLVQPGQRALDVGPGAGQLLERLAALGLQVAGCDLAEGMVEETGARLRQAGIDADLRTASAEDLPWAEASFDLVTALGLIEYLPNPAAGLAEMRRVLRPGGHLIVTAPNPVRLAYLADPIATIRGRLAPPKGGYPRKYWNPAKFRTAIEAAGLDVVSVEGHGLGPLTFAGRPLSDDARAIERGERLERRLGTRASRWLGANLIAVARRPGA